MNSFRCGSMALLTACGVENGIHEQTNRDIWHQVPTDQIDVLFVVDDSHSMAEEQAMVGAGFSDFVLEIEDSNTDFHLGVITTSFEYDDSQRGTLLGSPTVLTKSTPDYVTLFEDRVAVGTVGSDKEKAFEAAAYALSAPIIAGANEGFLRKGAFLLLVFVSDENDCSDEGALEGYTSRACYDFSEELVPVEEYVAAFQDLKDDPAKVRVGAIVGPKASQGGCKDAAPGIRYMDLANAMGGLVGDICEADYADILYDLGMYAAGVVTQFHLSSAARPETLRVYVAGPNDTEWEVPENAVNGWTYDPEAWVITFSGQAIPPRESTITVEYTIQAT